MSSNSIYTSVVEKFPSHKVMSYVYRGDNRTTGEFYIGYRMANVKKHITSDADIIKYRTSYQTLWSIYNNDSCFYKF